MHIKKFNQFTKMIMSQDLKETSKILQGVEWAWGGMLKAKDQTSFHFY